MFANPMDDWMHHMWGWGTWGMGWGMFLSLLALVLIGFAIYQAFYAPRGYRTRREDPLEIARRRYAEGEISREEHEELRRKLQE